MLAILSFLREEGTAYGLVTSRAGEHAADNLVDELSGATRSLTRALPRPLRVRAALRLARRLVRRADSQSRAVTRMRRGAESLEVRRSPFCAVREPATQPLCVFYAAALGRLLDSFDVGADTRVGGCRARGDAACLVVATVIPAVARPADTLESA